MDVNLIQNIVFAILFAYFIILVLRSLVYLVKFLTAEFILFLHKKGVIKNVDHSFIAYLRGHIINDK